jgi:translation elongation factor EF-Tu-like GTPase
MSEKLIGDVTHYFGNLSVAGIVLTGDLSVGDTIRISGHTTEFTQPVDSMQIDREVVEAAGAGDDIGIRVEDRVRIGDKVYKVTE